MYHLSLEYAPDRAGDLRGKARSQLRVPACVAVLEVFYFIYTK